MAGRLVSGPPIGNPDHKGFKRGPCTATEAGAIIPANGYTEEPGIGVVRPIRQAPTRQLVRGGVSRLAIGEAPAPCPGPSSPTQATAATESEEDGASNRSVAPRPDMYRP